ncbi:MAG TPA: aldolase/citrate lyase family protein [Longimicrobiales bacterium]|nr:aldolase/citrate lyase family protein [Longimicrobiales bacterium]
MPNAVVAQAARLNPIVELLAQKRPVFGLYAPRSNVDVPKTPAQLAQEALAYTHADFLFDGTMENAVRFERTLPAFAEFASAMGQAGVVENGRLRQPLVVKMHAIARDPSLAAQHIAQQLNVGVSAVVFVGVESAEEVRHGVSAMRLAAHGGIRPDDVGTAPALWGMTEQQYRERADVWPLNPRGELVNWTIVESREGLARVREIAAVPGIGVLFPGAGTLRGLFRTTSADGRQVFDEAAWEAAIQQVLAACKEFDVACGYPATESDIEKRMQQGFSVFIMNWGEPGFRAVELGRKVAGR